MERNYDEVISDMLIQLERIERSFEEMLNRLDKADRRMDLTIKRMVKAESRLEAQEVRMEMFDKKLDQSVRDQKEFSQMQSKLNRYFLDVLKSRGSKR